MLGSLARKIFGSRNDRLVKAMQKRVALINDLEAKYQALDDEALAANTNALKDRLQAGETLEQILPDAFATVREAARRVLGMRHFDVQLIGAMVLFEGRIAEMRTGEGKTLVGTAAVYLAALAGKGVHLITVNDYLARRDAAWMGRLYHFLGLSTGVINGSGGLGPDNSSFCVDPSSNGEDSGTPGLSRCTRKAAYAADITYGTNNEFGFDYLRDNMVLSLGDKTQRELNFAIVDEVDSILIDEARTPLIISGPAADTSELYTRIDKLMPNLRAAEDEESEGDYVKDEKTKQVHLTESGHEHVEALLVEAGILTEDQSLYDPSNISILHHLGAGLRAHAMYNLDVEYIVQDGQIVIVDEFTGRPMPGRRWSEGLHQAIEAKEGVEIQQENQTLASITFQNYFRQYNTLAGMTGTADTEAFEFQQIYNLEVVVIPTHRKMAREDRADLVFLTPAEKYEAIIEDICDCQKRGQPVLVGTTSVEVSEMLSKALKKRNIEHQVLNAKQHEREAHIVANAGRPGAVTIATNMAGRGTDIVLGGAIEHELAAAEDKSEAQIAQMREQWSLRHQAVIEAGGLHMIGTERHESRRIDNQLRGRSGRQGDPGSSRFYLSLQDSLMRMFASDRVSGLMQKLGMKDGEAIEHPWVTRAIENAQRKVEAHNFDIRKHLLEYDDVANDQRRVVYSERNEYMSTDEFSEILQNITEEVLSDLVAEYVPEDTLDEQWQLQALQTLLEEDFSLSLPIVDWVEQDKSLDPEGIQEKIIAAAISTYEEKRQLAGSENIGRFEKYLLINRLDDHWKEHLAAMDYLRQGIGLRGYAQRNPKQEYKREAFELFKNMLAEYRRGILQMMLRLQIRDAPPPEPEMPPATQLQYRHESAQSALDQAEPETELPEGPTTTVVRDGPKLGRNDPCHCGSGKKFKHCHGKLS